MIKILILSFVIIFTGCAQANHPKGSVTPQISMPDMPNEIVAAAICHHYTDYNLFTVKVAKINTIDDEIVRNDKMKDLLYDTFSKCVVELHGVINDYKNSF